jgi:DNA-binding HxlR family transcriptional regulator
MSNKTYNQYCAIAHALDTIGERWTLIIIRNLLIGPRRFSDLMKGLPGISTNILTDRLKQLEEQAVIHTRYLPPPAASTVYELTEHGLALTDVLAALARWASPSLGRPQPGQHLVLEGIAFMVIGVFHRATPPAFTLSCNLLVSAEGYQQLFGMQLSPQGIHLQEAALHQADVHLTIDLESLSTLSSGRARLQTLVDEQTVRLEGTSTTVDRLINWVDGPR